MLIVLSSSLIVEEVMLLFSPISISYDSKASPTTTVTVWVNPLPAINLRLYSPDSLANKVIVDSVPSFCWLIIEISLEEGTHTKSSILALLPLLTIIWFCLPLNK